MFHVKLCTPRKRRAWTERDDQLIRKFHAEGKNDATIGYIIDRRRTMIALRRRHLGLPANPAPVCRGYKRSAEQRARISECNRQRWRDPEQRAHFLEALAKARANRPKAFRPPKGTPEYRRYMKLCEVLGAPEARRALAEGRL